jgi:hypothetical protein
MKEAELIELLTEKAIVFLEEDDRNPEVGWGMNYWTAIDLSFKEVFNEAARWNTLAALQLELTDTIRNEVRVKVSAKRRGNMR